MSIQTELAPSPQPDGAQLLVPESVLREIAQELGTAIINRIMLADAVTRLRSQAQQQGTPHDAGNAEGSG